MKKVAILFISVLSLGLSLTSCNKDDGSTDSNTTSASLEGKWSYSKIDYSPVGGVEDYPFNNEGCSKNFLELKANGITSEGEYFGDECTLDLYAGTWTKDGNTITVTSEEWSNVYTLVSVSATELRLKEGNNTTYVFIRS